MDSLYPAAHFPTNDQQVHYDIEGSLVPDTVEPGLHVRKDDVQSGVPEVTPAAAPSPSQKMSIIVPIATPSTPAEAAVMQTSTQTSTGGSGSNNGLEGINPISDSEAIAADAQRRADHPSTQAVTTSGPATALPDVANAPGLSAPAVSSSTASTMATTSPPSSVAVMDSSTTLSNK